MWKPGERDRLCLSLRPRGARMLSPAVTPPACPTPAATIAEALDRIGPLHGLSYEDRLWLATHGQEVVAEAGSILFEEGSDAVHMILILKGEIHVRRTRGGASALFIWAMQAAS